MKATFYKIMLTLGCAGTVAAVSGEAQAYYYRTYHGHRYYYTAPVNRVYYRSNYHYRSGYYGVRKKCAGGYWRRGVWHPVHCWY
jgi:hypothetical protein